MLYYAPHILEVRNDAALQADRYGRPVAVSADGEWTHVCRCRCDINNETEFTDENGHRFRPECKVVCGDRGVPVYAGDHVRVMDGEKVRCEGRVIRPNKLNYLDYAEFWVQV